MTTSSPHQGGDAVFSAFRRQVRSVGPGVALCLGVTLLAAGIEAVERHFAGRAWLESLVLAIVLGTLIRTLWSPSRRFAAGIDFSAKTLLEIAVALLGLSISAAAVVSAGPGLILGIAALVALAIAISYVIGRGFGRPHRMSVLIACGNSICGNSAIAATAPVIHAEGSDVAASIAFTAVLGVLVVLGLPLLGPALGLSAMQYGIFAGLTVYAVPQVIAATAPIGALSVQIGTLVKLVRVLMLGPVVLALSLANKEGPRPRIHKLVPWFIVAFLALVAVRSFGLVPQSVLAPSSAVAIWLTVISMAALGLLVDVRVVAKAGLRAERRRAFPHGAGVASYALIWILKIASSRPSWRTVSKTEPKE